MSAEKNVALIQRIFDAFSRGDIQSILDDCAVDCEFHAVGPKTIPLTGTHVGREAIRNNYFGPLMTTQTGQNLKIDRYVAQGDTVVAIGRYTGTVKATGKPLDSPLAMIFEIESGKVKKYLMFSDTAAGQEAYTGASGSAAG